MFGILDSGYHPTDPFRRRRTTRRSRRYRRPRRSRRCWWRPRRAPAPPACRPPAPNNTAFPPVPPAPPIPPVLVATPPRARPARRDLRCTVAPCQCRRSLDPARLHPNRTRFCGELCQGVAICAALSRRVSADDRSIQRDCIRIVLDSAASCGGQAYEPAGNGGTLAGFNRQRGYRWPPGFAGRRCTVGGRPMNRRVTVGRWPGSIGNGGTGGRPALPAGGVDFRVPKCLNQPPGARRGRGKPNHYRRRPVDDHDFSWIFGSRNASTNRPGPAAAVANQITTVGGPSTITPACCSGPPGSAVRRIRSRLRRHRRRGGPAERRAVAGRHAVRGRRGRRSGGFAAAFGATGGAAGRRNGGPRQRQLSGDGGRRRRARRGKAATAPPGFKGDGG